MAHRTVASMLHTFVHSVSWAFAELEVENRCIAKRVRLDSITLNLQVEVGTERLRQRPQNTNLGDARPNLGESLVAFSIPQLSNLRLLRCETHAQFSNPLDLTRGTTWMLRLTS